MTARAKFGHFSGPGLEVPGGVLHTTGQYYNASGAAFVFLDANGAVSAALDATAGLAGWFTGVGFSPDAPEVSLDANNLYQFVTAARKYRTLIATPGDIFFCPSSAAFAQARLGELADITGAASNASAAAQKVNLGTTSTDVLRVMGNENTVDSTVYVQIYTWQADT